MTAGGREEEAAEARGRAKPSCREEAVRAAARRRQRQQQRQQQQQEAAGRPPPPSSAAMYIKQVRRRNSGRRHRAACCGLPRAEGRRGQERAPYVRTVFGSTCCAWGSGFHQLFVDMRVFAGAFW